MEERAEIIHDNFLKRVAQGDFPVARSNTNLQDVDLTENDLIQLFNSQALSRHLDRSARQLKQKQLSFYTIGSSGHEGNAGIAKAFRTTDPALLHYRSGGFYIQRLTDIHGCNPVRDIALSLIASSDDPISSGRHKVFGSFKGAIPPQTSTIASHCPKAVGLALSFARAKELAIEAQFKNDSVVLVSFGDASFNHASAQTAFNSACWTAKQSYPLPIVFICEDNGIGISVPTPRHWIEEAAWSKPWHTISVDGLNVLDVYKGAVLAEKIARAQKKPVFLHMKCVRLLGHAGSDIETVYRTHAALILDENNDPLLHTARLLIENTNLSGDDIIALYLACEQRVQTTIQDALALPKLTTKEAVMASIIPPKCNKPYPPIPTQNAREIGFGAQWQHVTKPRTMAQHINYALTDLMLQHKNMLIFGEDVGRKGGVYHVTADLQARFTQKRVFDSILDETTILGTAIGLAQNGFLPIPEIQFLAYFHNAEDQLRGEAATLSFFSSGQFTNPMVIRIAGLAYQRGFGGHFHNDNSIAAIRDIPGVILAIPSNGVDAAMMLKECVYQAAAQQRVVVFLEPIALYAQKDLFNAGDNLYLAPYDLSDKKCALGDVGVYGDEAKIAIITYGNGVYLSRRAQRILQQESGIATKIIDLRWLAPLPVDALFKELKQVDTVLVVDECRRTGSVSEAIVTALVESNQSFKKISRVTAEDSFIPLGQAWETVLPSVEDIVIAIKKIAECQPAAA